MQYYAVIWFFDELDGKEPKVPNTVIEVGSSTVLVVKHTKSVKSLALSNISNVTNNLNLISTVKPFPMLNLYRDNIWPVPNSYTQNNMQSYRNFALPTFQPRVNGYGMYYGKENPFPLSNFQYLVFWPENDNGSVPVLQNSHKPVKKKTARASTGNVTHIHCANYYGGERNKITLTTNYYTGKSTKNTAHKKQKKQKILNLYSNKIQLGKSATSNIPKICYDDLSTVEMENEINDAEFDYLQSLANEELKIPTPNLANLKIDSDKNYSCVESFFLPEARDSDTNSDTDSDTNSGIEEIESVFLTQI